MSQHLQELAKRVEDDPFFLACLLRLYAESEEMTVDQLAAALGCSEETMIQVKLCRAPAGEAKSFQTDVDRIAERFGVRAELLAAAARRGDVLLKMRDANASNAFMAARDRTNDRGSEP